MSTIVKYMPIFRLRTQEKQVLLSRHFGDNVFPLLEIIKRFEIKPREPKQEKKRKSNGKRKEEKTFEQVYLPILKNIKARKVFVDLPVHMKQPPNMKPEVVEFLRKVVDDRNERTAHILKFAEYSDRVIPVVSTYMQKRNNEPNSIKLQEKDLRPTFSTIAFRTFPATFSQDIKQIEAIVKNGDFIIYDLENTLIDKEDPDVIKSELESLRNDKGCEIIIVRNVVSSDVKNSEIQHGKKIDTIVSDLIGKYIELHGSGFGDYVGIKKDGVTKGAGISPGFLLFDPVENAYYGFRGDVYKEDGKIVRKVSDFEKIIVPDVLKSAAISRMKKSGLPYLNDINIGWKKINGIKAGSESGQSQAKFKRISMEHYLHCIMTQIDAGMI